VVVEKAFAKRLPWAGWTYSFAKKRKVYGMHIVVVLWCSQDLEFRSKWAPQALTRENMSSWAHAQTPTPKHSCSSEQIKQGHVPTSCGTPEDGRWRIPVAFPLWRPKRTCAPHRYQTKLQLAARILTELVAARLPFAYLVADTHCTAGWLTRLAGRLGVTWVGTLLPRTTVVLRGRRQQAAELAARLRLGWRPRLGLRAAVVTVYAPKYGMLRLVVTRNRHGNYEYLATNELTADLARVVARKQSRWNVETIFRDTKQYAGLGACQCWTDAAMVRHVALVLVAFVVLQQLRVDPSEPIAAVKQRWQLAIIRQSELPPPPHNTRPAHLRAMR
jgi:hypothetical protein